MDISGDRWKEHRKFAVLQLRELGVGKPLMESKILIEAEELIKKLKTAEILNEDFLLQVSIFNVFAKNNFCSVLVRVGRCCRKCN